MFDLRLWRPCFGQRVILAFSITRLGDGEIEVASGCEQPGCFGGVVLFALYDMICKS